MANIAQYTIRLKNAVLLKVTINSIKKRMTVNIKTSFREVLFYLFEGTSVNIPLDLFENHPLASIPPLAPTAL